MQNDIYNPTSREITDNPLIPKTQKRSQQDLLTDAFFTRQYNLADKRIQYGSQLVGSKFEQTLTPSQLLDIEDVRASRQGTWDLIGNGTVRFAGSTATKFLTGFGYVGAFVPWLATGMNKKDISMVTDNIFSKTLSSWEEALKEAMPVYKSKEYRTGDIWDQIGTGEFWADDAVDGVAFLTSALIPGGVFSKTGLALKSATTIGKAFAKASAAAKAGEVISTTANVSEKALNAISKGLTVGVHTAYNTISEGMFEAKDFKESLTQQLLDDRKNGLNNYTDEEILSKASSGASEVFSTNAKILLASNMLEGGMIYGGLISKVKKGLGVATGLEKVAKEGIKQGVGRYIGTSLIAGATSAVSEGLWQENAQAAIQNYEKYKQLGLTDMPLIEGMAYEMTEGLASNTDTQKQVFLGALLGLVSGGIMGGVETAGETKKHNVLYSLIKDIKDPDVLTKKMKDYYEKDSNGKFVKDENGNLVRNVKKMAEAISKGITSLKSSQAFFESIEKGDYNLADYIWFDHVAEKAYGLMGEEDSSDYLKNLFKGGIEDMLNQFPDLAGLDKNSPRNERIEAIQKKFETWVDTMKRMHDIAEETTSNYEVLGLDRKKDKTLRENLKYQQYKNSLKQFYLNEKIKEEESRLGESKEAFYPGGEEAKNAALKPQEELIQSLKDELENTIADYSELTNKDAIREAAKREQEFAKAFKGTKEEVAYAKNLRTRLQNRLHNHNLELRAKQKKSERINDEASSVLDSEEFNALSLTDKVNRLSAIVENFSDSEITTENKQRILDALNSIKDEDIDNYLSDLETLESAVVLSATDEKFVIDAVDRIFPELSGSLDINDLDMLDSIANEASSRLESVRNIKSVKHEALTKINNKESVEKFSDWKDIDRSQMKFDYVKDQEIDEIDKLISDFENPDFTDDAKISAYIKNMNNLKKVIPQMYEFNEKEGQVDTLNKFIDNAIERANKLLEDVKKRKQDKQLLENKLREKDTIDRLGSVGIKVGLTAKSNKDDIERRRQEELENLAPENLSVMASDYLLNGGVGSILSSDYYLQGLSGTFINASKKISEIKNKYASEVNSKYADINSFIGTELYNAMMDEIRLAIKESYTTNEASSIFDTILQYPTGVPIKIGTQLSIKLDQINNTADQINAKYDAELKNITYEESGINSITDENSKDFLDLFKGNESIMKAYNMLKGSIKDNMIPFDFVEGLLSVISKEYKANPELKSKVDIFISEQNIVAKKEAKRSILELLKNKFLFRPGLPGELLKDDSTLNNQEGVYLFNPRFNLFSILNQLNAGELGGEINSFLIKIADIIVKNNSTVMLREQLKQEGSKYSEESKEKVFFNLLGSFLDAHDKLCANIDMRLNMEAGVDNLIVLADEIETINKSQGPALSNQQRITLYSSLKALLTQTYQAVVIKGIAGAGKTMMVKFLLNSLNIKSDELLLMSYDQDTVTNLKNSVGIEADTKEFKYSNDQEEFKKNVFDWLSGKRLVVFDEFAFPEKLEIERFFKIVNENFPHVKIVFLGDPTQLKAKNETSPFAYKTIYKENKLFHSRVYEAPSLNIKYRTSVSDVDNVSEAYQSGRVLDRNFKAKTNIDNDLHPSLGAGIFNEDGFFSKLINNIKLGQKVSIIVSGNNANSRILSKLKESIPNYGALIDNGQITIMDYLNSQGKTLDNVYVYAAVGDDLSVSDYDGIDLFRRAMYVATSRAKNLLVVYDAISKPNSDTVIVEDLKSVSKPASYNSSFRQEANEYYTKYKQEFQSEFSKPSNNTSSSTIEIEFEETSEVQDGIKTEENLSDSISNEEQIESEEHTNEASKQEYKAENITQKVVLSSPQYGLFGDSLSNGDEVLYVPVMRKPSQGAQYTSIWIVKKLEDGTFLKIGEVDRDKSLGNHPNSVQMLIQSSNRIDEDKIEPVDSDSKDAKRNNVYRFNTNLEYDKVSARVANFNPITFNYDSKNREMSDPEEIIRLTEKVIAAVEANGLDKVDKQKTSVKFKIYKKISKETKQVNRYGRTLKRKSGIPYIVVTVRGDKGLGAERTPFTYEFNIIGRPKEIAKSSKANDYKSIKELYNSLSAISLIYNSLMLSFDINGVRKQLSELIEYGSPENNGMSFEYNGREIKRTKGSTFYSLLLIDNEKAASELDSNYSDLASIETAIREKLGEQDYEKLLALRKKVRELCGTKIHEADKGFDNLKGINPEEYTEENLENLLKTVSQDEYKNIRTEKANYTVLDEKVQVYGQEFDVVEKRDSENRVYRYARRVYKIEGEREGDMINVVYVSQSVPISDNNTILKNALSVHTTKLKVPVSLFDKNATEEEVAKAREIVSKQIVSKDKEDKSIHKKNEFDFRENKVIMSENALRTLAFKEGVSFVVKSKFDKNSGKAQNALNEIAKSNVRTKSGNNIRVIQKFAGKEIVKSKSLLNSNPTPATKSHYTNLKGETVEYDVAPITLESLKDIQDFDNNGLMVNIPINERTEEFTDNRKDVTFRLSDITPTKIEIAFEDKVVPVREQKEKVKEEPKVEEKKGVSELFESNPELANAVYEALGFTGNISDIERRRPTSYIRDSKDKKSPLETFRNEAKREWDGVSVITGDRMKNLYVGIQLFVEAYPEHKDLLDKFIKKENGTIGITNNNLSFVLNTLKKQGVTTESELGVKINAKYDAELAKLNNQITPQQKQQARQLYSQYLDTIFPDSKVKDIVYRGKTDSQTNIRSKELGIFFTDNKSAANIYAVKYKGDEFDDSIIQGIVNKFGLSPTIEQIKSEIAFFEKMGATKEQIEKDAKEFQNYILNNKGVSEQAILNIKNPKNLTVKDWFDNYDNSSTLKENSDGILLKGGKQSNNRIYDAGENQIVVFEPEQIHILGSKQDIEGFKEFAEKPIKSETKPEVKAEVKEEPKEKKSTKSKLEDENDYDEKLFREGMDPGKVISQEEAIKIAKELFPGITDEQIRFVSTAEMIFLTSGKNAWGLFKKGTIYLLKDSDNNVRENVLKHEAFHKAFWSFLSASERAKMISEAKVYNTSLKSSSDSKIEEWLADEFAKYSKLLKTKFGRLILAFKKLYNFLTFSSKNWKTLEMYFDRLNNGYYSMDKVIDEHPMLSRKMALTNKYRLNTKMYEDARKYIFHKLFSRLYPSDDIQCKVIESVDENGNKVRRITNVPMKKKEIFASIANIKTIKDEDGVEIPSDLGSLLADYERLSIALENDPENTNLQSRKTITEYLLFGEDNNEKSKTSPRNLFSVIDTFRTGKIRSDEEAEDEQEFESNLVNEISDGTEVDLEKNINTLVKDILLLTAIRDENDNIVKIPNYGAIFNMLTELVNIDLDSKNIESEIEDVFNNQFSSTSSLANALKNRLILRKNSIYRQMRKTSFELSDSNGVYHNIELPSNMRFVGEDMFVIANKEEDITNTVNFEGVKKTVINRNIAGARKSSNAFFLDILDAIKKAGYETTIDGFNTDNLNVTIIKSLFTKEKSRQHWISIMSFIKSIRYRNLIYGTSISKFEKNPYTGMDEFSQSHVVSGAENIGNLRNSNIKRIINQVSKKVMDSKNAIKLKSLLSLRKNSDEEKLDFVIKFLNEIGFKTKKIGISIPAYKLDVIANGVTSLIQSMTDTIESIEKTSDGIIARDEKIREIISGNLISIVKDLSESITKSDADNRSYNVFGRDKKMRFTNVISSWALHTVRDLVRFNDNPSRYKVPKHLRNEHYSKFNPFVKLDDNGRPMSAIRNIYDWMIQAYKGIPFTKEYSRENTKDFIRREFMFDFVSIIARDNFSNNRTYYQSPYAISNKSVMHSYEIDLLEQNKVKEFIRLAYLQEFDKQRMANEMNEKGTMVNSFESSKFVFGHLQGEEISKYSVDDIDSLVNDTYNYILSNAEKSYESYKNEKIIPISEETSKAYKNLVEAKILQEGVEDETKELFKLFSLNNYVNSYFINQLYMGDVSFLGKAKGIPAAVIKRASSVYGIGQSPYTGTQGLRQNVRIGIMNDFWDVKTPLNDWSGKYGDAMFTPYEVSNAETYMTPEYYDELKYNGYGYDYNLGEILKPIIWYVGEDGNPYMLKTSVVVITDELANNFPELRQIRERMRNSKMDMMTFPSGFKYGYPKNIPGFFQLNKGVGAYMDIDSKDFRIQFNPYHEDEQTKGVKLLTQFTYIASIGDHNMNDANELYSALSNIIRAKTEKYNRNVFKNGKLNKKKLRKIIIDALANVGGSEIIAHALSYKASAEDKGKLIFQIENGRAPSEEELKSFIEKNNIKSGYLINHNLPDLARKVTSVLISNFSKQSVEIRFKGGKFVLQESVNAKVYRKDGKVKLYSELSNSEKENADRFYSKDSHESDYNMQRAILELNEANEYGKLSEYLELISLSEIKGKDRAKQITEKLKSLKTLTREEEARFPKEVDFDNIWFVNLTDDQLSELRSYISDNKLNDNYVKEFSNITVPSRLRMVDDNGVPTAEVIMPKSQAIVLAKKLGLNKVEDLLTSTIGVRIPTSGFNTTLLLKVVSFTSGNRIIVPEEVSLIHGSDFDVDSMFVLNYDLVSSDILDTISRLSESASEQVQAISNKIKNKLELSNGFVVGRNKSAELIENFEESLSELKKSIDELTLLESEYANEYNKLLDVLSDVEEKYWKNKSIDSYKNILKNEKNFKERMSPVSMDIIQNYLIGRITEEIYGRDPKQARDLGLIKVKETTHKNVFSSSQDIGIIASGIRTLSYLSYIARKNGQRLRLDPEHLSIKFNGFDYQLEQQEEKATTSGFSFSATRLYDAFLNGAVDDVKNQTMYILNFTSLTAGSYTLLTKFGVPFWTNYLFHAQPIMSKYISSGDFNRNVNNDIKEIYNVLNISEDPQITLYDKDMAESLSYFTKNELTISDAIAQLRELVNANVKDDAKIKQLAKYLIIQAAVANKFKSISEVSSGLINVSQMFNLTRKLPTNVSDLISLINTYEKSLPEFSNLGVKEGSVYDNVNHLLESVNSVKNFRNMVLNKFMYINSSLFTNFFNKINTIIKIKVNEFRSNSEEDADFVKNEFIKYIISSYPFRKINVTQNEVSSKETEFRLGETDIVKLIHKEVPRYLSADDSWIESFCNEVKKQQILKSDNVFMKYISVETNPDNGTSYIKFNLPASSSIDDEQAIIAAFLNLSENPRVDEYTDFQKGFLKYAIIKNGMGFEATGFSQYLPIELRAGVSNYMENMYNYLNGNKLISNNLLTHFALSLAVKHPELIKNEGSNLLKVSDEQREFMGNKFSGYYTVSKEDNQSPIIVKKYGERYIVLYKSSVIDSNNFPSVSKTDYKITLYKKIADSDSNFNYNIPIEYITDLDAENKLKSVAGDLEHRIVTSNKYINLNNDSILHSEYVSGNSKTKNRSKYSVDVPLSVGEVVYMRDKNDPINSNMRLFKVISVSETTDKGLAMNVVRLQNVANEALDEFNLIQNSSRDIIENAVQSKSGRYLNDTIIGLVKTHGIGLFNYTANVNGQSVNPFEILMSYKTSISRANEELEEVSDDKNLRLYKAFKNGLKINPESMRDLFASNEEFASFKEKSKLYLSSNGLNVNDAISKNDDLSGTNVGEKESYDSTLDISPSDVLYFMDKFTKLSQYQYEIMRKNRVFEIANEFKDIVGIDLNEKLLNDILASNESFNSESSTPFIGEEFEGNEIDVDYLKEEYDDKLKSCTK